MTNSLNNLFATESNLTISGTRGLAGTAQLTNIANNIAIDIIKEMNEGIDDYRDMIRASQSDNNAMDALIDQVHPLEDVDIEFLKDLSDATLDGMLKSQQSKRSRCKSKTMTVDNYKALMVGAIAENLIRIASGKEKHSSGARRVAGAIEYTIEQLEALGVDQEKLKKEIRNVQSKKSIMKSKAGFSEDDERYQTLLKVERQLKDMRTGHVQEVVEVDTTKNALLELLSDVDIETLTVEDSHELLRDILGLAID